MKLILNAPPEQQDFVLVENLPVQPIIGFQNPQGKGWVQPAQYGEFRNNQYRLMCVDDGVKKGNSYGTKDENIKTIFNWFGKYLKTTKLFLFDSEQELFKWLSKP